MTFDMAHDPVLPDDAEAAFRRSLGRALRTCRRTPLVELGDWWCPPSHPAWSMENVALDTRMVFPHVPVGIHPREGDPITADPSVVVFYNRGDHYRRTLLSDRGDECEWLAFDRAVVASAVAEFDPSAADHPDHPFRTRLAPTSDGTEIARRRLLAAMRAPDLADDLAFEEAGLALLRSSLCACSTRRPVAPDRRRRADTAAAHHDLTDRVQSMLCVRFREPLGLAQIARLVSSSPYHMCRVFRACTGLTIHDYRDRLRGRAALDLLEQGGVRLADMADWLGYSSHAHFTDAFRRRFGLPPSAYRALASRTDRTEIRQLAARLVPVAATDTGAATAEPGPDARPPAGFSPV